VLDTSKPVFPVILHLLGERKLVTNHIIVDVFICKSDQDKGRFSKATFLPFELKQ